MNDLTSYNVETAEYALLTFIRRLGLEIERGYLVNGRTGQRWQAERIVSKAS